MDKDVYSSKARLLQPATNFKQEMDRFIAQFCHKTSKILATKLCFSVYACECGPTDKKILIQVTKTLHTRKFIDTIYRWVFALYGFLLTTVNNCGGQMTATLWRQLCKRYCINIEFFSAHHLEIDGQIKSTNRVIKNYLHMYIAYTQDNWMDQLPMAKFATNNHVNIFTLYQKLWKLLVLHQSSIYKKFILHQIICFQGRFYRLVH